MSREIKRVPLDFDAPIGETWAALLMPAELRLPTCPACDGCTRDSSFRWVEHIAHLLMMLGEEPAAQERGRHLHPWLRDAASGYRFARPTASILELTTGLAEREPSFMGHDAIDSWRATKKIVAAAGLDIDTWAVCKTCDGKGHTGTREQVTAREAWEPAEVPTGDGWQLWQTVSEGGPVSPVFAAPEELARWMIANRGALSPGDRSINYDTALKWVTGPGWAISGAFNAEGEVSPMELSLGGGDPE